MFCLDSGKLVFVDESGFHLAMTPSYARAAKGKRAYGQEPRNRGENTSFLAALSLNGLQAPMTLQGSVDGIAFETYVEQVLGPTLTTGQIVVLDNHRIHKGDKVAELLAAHGYSLLFLPPSNGHSPVLVSLVPIRPTWTLSKKPFPKSRPLSKRVEQGLETPLIKPSPPP